MSSDIFENVDLSSIADDSLISKNQFSKIGGDSGIQEVSLSEDWKPGNNSDYNDVKTEKINSDRKPTGRPIPNNNVEDATVIDLPVSVKVDPAVGWLVCVSGVDKGRSFRLVKGNNSIGRPGSGNTYAISLTDQSISRKGACGVIVYNEKSNQFFITPGDLTNNINPYLNDEILLSPKLLYARDILEISGDVLIFIPFCCEKFKWNFSNVKQNAASEPLRNEERNDIVRCEKGHYYNAAINNSCPICAQIAAEANDPNGQTKIW